MGSSTLFDRISNVTCGASFSARCVTSSISTVAQKSDIISEKRRVEVAGSNPGRVSIVVLILIRISRTGSIRLSPSGVGTILRPTWTSRSSPKYWRSRASAPLMADWVRCTRLPACVMFFSSSSAYSATSRFRSS